MIEILNDPNTIPAADGSSPYGNFRTRTFSQIWKNEEAFEEDYNNNGIPVSITNTSIKTLFYLLYARYGNSSIASSDETQFIYKVFSTIFMYGPAWEKRLDIQKKLLTLSEEEIVKGSTAIYNTALNPSSAPSTSSLEELPFISQQNATKYKKSKVDAYATLYSLIETDVTEQFIGRFKKLFITVVEPNSPLWYVTKGEQK